MPPADLAGGAAPQAQQSASRAADDEDGADGAETRPPLVDTFQALVRAIHSGPWRDAPAWWSAVRAGIPQADLTLSLQDREEAARMVVRGFHAEMLQAVSSERLQRSELKSLFVRVSQDGVMRIGDVPEVGLQKPVGVVVCSARPAAALFAEPCSELGMFRFLANADDPFYGSRGLWCEAVDPGSKEVFHYHTATLETTADVPAGYDPRADVAFRGRSSGGRRSARPAGDIKREAVACLSRRVVFLQVRPAAAFAENMGPLVRNEYWGFENKDVVEEQIRHDEGHDEGPAADAQASINMVAASLLFNNLSPEEGYDTFALPAEDGRVSFATFVAGMEQLSLGISLPDCRAVFERLDPNKTGFIAKAEWVHVMAKAKTEDIFTKRGLDPAAFAVPPRAASSAHADSPAAASAARQPASLETDGAGAIPTLVAAEKTVTIVLWLDSARRAELITAGMNHVRPRDVSGLLEYASSEDSSPASAAALDSEQGAGELQAVRDIRLPFEKWTSLMTDDGAEQISGAPSDQKDRHLTAVEFLALVALHASREEEEAAAVVAKFQAETEAEARQVHEAVTQSLVDTICDEILKAVAKEVAEEGIVWFHLAVESAVEAFVMDQREKLLEGEAAEACRNVAEVALQESKIELEIQAEQAVLFLEDMTQSLLDVLCREVARTEFRAAVFDAQEPEAPLKAQHIPHAKYGEFVVEKKPLAHGSFKSVYKATWSKEKNRWVVILVIRNTSSANLVDLQNEIEVFSVLGKHRHLAELLATTTHPQSGDQCMVMEFAEQGSLDNVLVSAVEHDIVVSDQVLLTIAVQVADAMMQLELHQVIHRDLAARNILVFQFDATDWTKVLVKVTDYGLALLAEKGSTAGKMVSTHGASLAGPIRWMAPESLQRRMYSLKSDVWAYGVLVWEILTLGLVPYHAIPTDEAVAAAVVSGKRLERPEHCPEAVWAVLLSCWRDRPKDRPTMAEILAKLQVAFAAQMFKASECVVCIENEAVMALMPCGHRCACEACAPNLRNCPMCRQPVRESTRIYG